MKPIELNEILEWKPRGNLRILRNGDSLKCKITSDCFYQCFEGEEDMTGKISPYNSYQVAVFDEGTHENTALVVPKTLGYTIVQQLLKAGKTLDDLQDTRWAIKRIGRYSWDVEFIEKGASKEKKEDTAIKNLVNEAFKLLKEEDKIVAYVKSLKSDAQDQAIRKAIALKKKEENVTKEKEQTETTTKNNSEEDDEWADEWED